jgi:hypothetical protein
MKTTELLLEKHHSWVVRKELPDGMFSACRYNGAFPVTAEQVAGAPSVREWLGSHRLDAVYHPEPQPEAAQPEKGD